MENINLKIEYTPYERPFPFLQYIISSPNMPTLHNILSFFISFFFQILQEVHSDSHIALQFLDEVTGAESSWMLHVTSSVAACHIIQAIRTPWSQLFNVDLQVTYHKRSQDQKLIRVT